MVAPVTLKDSNRGSLASGAGNLHQGRLTGVPKVPTIGNIIITGAASCYSIGTALVSLGTGLGGVGVHLEGSELFRCNGSGSVVSVPSAAPHLVPLLGS